MTANLFKPVTPKCRKQTHYTKTGIWGKWVTELISQAVLPDSYFNMLDVLSCEKTVWTPALCNNHLWSQTTCADVWKTIRQMGINLHPENSNAQFQRQGANSEIQSVFAAKGFSELLIRQQSQRSGSCAQEGKRCWNIRFVIQRCSGTKYTQ